MKKNTEEPQESAASRGGRIPLFRRILVWLLVVLFWVLYFWTRRSP